MKNNKKSYFGERMRNLARKENLSPEEFLLSDAFKGFCTRLAQNISGSPRVTVNIKPLAGTFVTDKKEISIGLQSVYPLIERLRKEGKEDFDILYASTLNIIGSVAHEVFHLLYTDMKILKKVEQHNNPSLMHHILNIIEDGAIERIGTTQYEGYFKDGIIYSNNCVFEERPSLEEFSQQGESDCFLLLEASIVYAVLGKLKGSLPDNLLDDFKICVEHIDAGKASSTTEKRYEEALSLYDEVFAKYKDDIEQMQNLMDISMSGTFTPQKERSDIENSSPAQIEGKKTKELLFGVSLSGPDEDSDGNENGEGSENDEKGDSSENERQMSMFGDDANGDDSDDSDDSGNDKSSGAKDDGNKDVNKGETDSNADSVKTNSFTPVDIDDTVKTAIIETLKEALEEKTAEKIQEELDEIKNKTKDDLMDYMDFTVNVLKQDNIIALENLSLLTSKYGEIAKNNKVIIKALSSKLEKILRYNEDRKNRNLLSGSKIYSPALHKTGIDGKIFYNRTSKSDEVDLTVVFLVDASGSMRDNFLSKKQQRSLFVSKKTQVTEILVVMNEVLKNFAIDTSVIFHRAFSLENRIELTYAKDFYTLDKKDPCICGMSPEGNAREDATLEYVTRTLKSVPGNKIIFMLSDGEPCHSDAHMTRFGIQAAKKNIGEIIRKNRYDCRIIGVGIGDKTVEKSIKEMYRESITISEISELPQKFTTVIQNALLRN